MNTKKIWLLERTKDSESHIIGFYRDKATAVDAIHRYVTQCITDALTKHEEGTNVIGVYISEGFLLTSSQVEIDAEIGFAKIEDAQEFPDAVVEPARPDKHHIAEDLGDVKDPVIRAHEKGQM